MNLNWLAGILALVLALVHVFAKRLRAGNLIPRNVWLSIAGGIAVAFVFVHVLPDLHERQQTPTAAGTVAGFLENHAYFLILLGLVAFYGLERIAKTSRQNHRGQDRAEKYVFWLHMGSYGLYNGLIGYLLIHREVSGFQNLILFAVAIGFHFVVNDQALREDHKDLYHNIGRWILAVAVLAGWGIANIVNLSNAVVTALYAFIAGAIILTVLKEELPAERESHFWAFAGGAVGYAAVMLVIEL